MSLPLSKSCVVFIQVFAIVLIALVSGTTASAQQLQCTPATGLTRIPELPEGSGLAASRSTAGRFWSHNDSGEPVLYSLDGEGRVTGRLKVSGATVEDWEAIAVGSCPKGTCLYVGDIGDNEAKRQRITVYRITEPTAAAGSAATVDVFHATYPDGAHDAESLLIAADGRLHIVTKGDTGPVALYRFPTELQSGTTMRLERVGAPRTTDSSPRDERITDGSVSPDGRWIALRSNQSVTFYAATDLLAGNWRESGRVTLTPLAEPQGEGITFGPGNSVYLISEGGSKKQPGTFARLTCSL
jgi:hypothetical protein